MSYQGDRLALDSRERDKVSARSLPYKKSHQINNCVSTYRYIGTMLSPRITTNRPTT